MKVLYFCPVYYSRNGGRTHAREFYKAFSRLPETGVVSVYPEEPARQGESEKSCDPGQAIQKPGKIRKFLRDLFEKLYIYTSIRHISGPKRINYDKNEAVVTCLVRNGDYYIESFIKHYFALGVKHIILLDNN